MENVLHERWPGNAIWDPAGWTYFTVCGAWVKSYDLAFYPAHVNCPECRADLELAQDSGEATDWVRQIPSQAVLWVDPP